MWMIYGKRTKAPYEDKQFRMLTAKGMRTTKSEEAMIFMEKKDAEVFLEKIKAGKTYYDPIFEIRKAKFSADSKPAADPGVIVAPVYL